MRFRCMICSSVPGAQSYALRRIAIPRSATSMRVARLRGTDLFAVRGMRHERAFMVSPKLA
eukprot:4421752-Prymnesium_polylepis.1